ncbi:MAG: heme ABC exporter ATP-binding protein CcmA [Vitreimonas sp.]
MSGSGPFQDKPSLRVEGLMLSRGARTLVRDLSFTAAAGDLVEVRGPNGSGKTTLLRALAGFFKPQGGRLAYEGVEEPALALHYVGHVPALKGAASVRAHVCYWQGLFGVTARDSVTIAAFGLIKQAALPVRALSQGQQRRLALARLHLAARPIWLLDEPAAGLDADGREMLAEFIESHRLQGGIAIAAVHGALGPPPSRTVTLGA